MHVEWQFFGPLREAVGEKTLHRDLDADATVGDALADVVGAHPDLRGQLAGEDAGVAQSVNLTCDGTDVRHMEGTDTPLSDGAVRGGTSSGSLKRGILKKTSVASGWPSASP